MIEYTKQVLQMALQVKKAWADKTLALACIDAVEEDLDVEHWQAVRLVCKWRSKARRDWEWREARRVMKDEPLVVGPLLTMLRKMFGLEAAEPIEVRCHMRRENVYVVEAWDSGEWVNATPMCVTISPRWLLSQRTAIMADWMKRMNGEASRVEAPLSTSILTTDPAPTA